jgi:lysophospholipase L1-like esterase
MVVAATAVSCLALLPATSAQGAVRAAPRPGAMYALAFRLPGPAAEAAHPREPAAGCERQLERTQHQHQYQNHDAHGGPSRPALAIVGASFTAGVGPGNPGKSWAVVLARLLHWDADVYGVPGAGYVRAGAGRKGPVAAEIARLDLRALVPALVIVQAGHDDIGVPLRLERRRVEQAVALIHAEAPHARIALLTVFAGRSRSAAGHSGMAAAYRIDHAIVTAGRAADRDVIIIDPLAAGWTFPRVRDGLHPTAPGSVWIADQVARILREHGVRPAPPQPGKAAAIICDSGIPALAPRR